jgi:hypothetical protein
MYTHLINSISTSAYISFHCQLFASVPALHTKQTRVELSVATDLSMPELDNLVSRYTAEYVELFQQTPSEPLNKEAAAALAPNIVQALADCTDKQAWNALCLLWPTYRSLFSKSVPPTFRLPNDICEADEKTQVGWLQMHEICSKLASCAEPAAPKRTIALLNAQIAFNSAHVR